MKSKKKRGEKGGGRLSQGKRPYLDCGEMCLALGDRLRVRKSRKKKKKKTLLEAIGGAKRNPAERHPPTNPALGEWGGARTNIQEPQRPTKSSKSQGGNCDGSKNWDSRAQKNGHRGSD